MIPLLICGIVGAVTFVATFLIDGATRPDYRPTFHPVSALSLGSRGWLQTTNFVLCGALIAASAPGLWIALEPGRGAVIVPVLIAAYGLALVASGIFRMDPMREYPPGTPAEDPVEFSTAHTWHDHAGIVVFSALPLACAVMVLRFAGDGAVGWAVYSGASGVAALALFVAFGAGWEQQAPRNGLVQRFMIGTGAAWIAALCLHLATSS